MFCIFAIHLNLRLIKNMTLYESKQRLRESTASDSELKQDSVKDFPVEANNHFPFCGLQRTSANLFCISFQKAI